jgi:hypothetical protein
VNTLITRKKSLLVCLWWCREGENAILELHDRSFVQETMMHHLLLSC